MPAKSPKKSGKAKKSHHRVKNTPLGLVQGEKHPIGGDAPEKLAGDVLAKKIGKGTKSAKSQEKGTITITCEGAALVEWEKLTGFQGELKSLAEVDYQKLKSEILALGFSFPVAVWRQGKNFNIIDGHQRVKTIGRMVKEDGFECPPLPVAWVDAKSYEEAKAKVLGGASQFGKIQAPGLQLLANAAKLSAVDLKNRFRFPEIDLAQFAANSDNIKNKIGGARDVEFSTHIGECNHYVVLKFENEIDWLQAQSHFKLKPVVAQRANGKPWSAGIGRVLDGADYLKDHSEGKM